MREGNQRLSHENRVYTAIMKMEIIVNADE
jgi:hypothetical protein